MLKFIVVTGGVLSGLGKGIAAASIGHLLSDKYKVIPIKCDGYLNVDPGTMNPVEHGEVFVLDDGGEVDMDFGHYERFLGITCKFKWNLTMGKVFNEIREKERRGDYLGKTVQYVPHVTNLIKEKFFEIAKEEDADIVLIEIGGTIGDMENELYLEAARQLKNDVGSENVLYVHLTYVPILSAVNEQKSKPTQQSVHLLLQKGVQPDIIIGRCSEYLEDRIKEKIAQFCNIKKEAVITGLDVDDLYKIPMVFEQEGIINIISRHLKIRINKDLHKWKELIRNRESAKKNVTVAICGKYTQLEDSYASIIESLNHCSSNLNCKISLKWVDTTDETKIESQLKGVDGIIVPGGFGSRGTEGKMKAIKYARENNIPFLGLCFGLQMAVAEFARNVCKLEGANSTEIDPKTKYPVIDILPEQKNVTSKGGTMRLGAYDAYILKNSKVYELYNSVKVSERHRHRYEVNPEYHKVLQEKGMLLSGTSQDGKLVEFIELPKHKFFVATQAHPELKSSLDKPAPLFYGFVKACMK
ncbi:CTP synthase (glutamine hydrolyzing) [Candidatus Woesearchaeota archaeon]|nr:CTP synthase (glutamine hydrolyzing) [Candidatus Woesearchaeota archaeon]